MNTVLKEFEKAEKYQINQNYQIQPAHNMVLIPYGYKANFGLFDQSQPGDLIYFRDMKLHRIVRKSVILTISPIADTLAQAIYGKSIQDVIEDLRKQYGNSVGYEELVVIVYETIQVPSSTISRDSE